MYQRLFHLPIQSKDSFFVFGPRGTGKTAWLKQMLNTAQHIYIDLLDHKQFRELSSRPELLEQMIPNNFKGRVIIDEVQKIPALLDHIHRLIEQQKIRFILTGSSARKLKQSGVNLLAGRAIYYTMHPLLIQELGDDFNLMHALRYGMLPATYNYDDPEGYLATYIDTYLREEVIQEGLTRNLSAFIRFLETASYSQGNTVNASSIAREISIDRQVVQGYFSILDDLLLAHWIPPFTKRAKRQLIKSEKFYFFDLGIYRHLRPKGILDADSEIAGPALETLFLQSAKALIAYNRLSEKIYYWRTRNGLEVDFIIYGEQHFYAFEIKHSKNIDNKMLRGLKEFKQDYPMVKPFVLYLGEHKQYFSDDMTALPFVEGLKQLEILLAKNDATADSAQ